MAEAEANPDDAIALAFIEEHYVVEQELHTHRPCNWCKEEKTGSFDCAGAPAIKSAVFLASRWYAEAPPRHYQAGDKTP